MEKEKARRSMTGQQERARDDLDDYPRTRALPRPVKPW